MNIHHNITLAPERGLVPRANSVVSLGRTFERRLLRPRCCGPARRLGSCLALTLSAHVVEGAAGAGRSVVVVDQPNFSYNARPLARESLGYLARAAQLPTN